MVIERKALYDGTFTRRKDVNDNVEPEDIVGYIFQAFDHKVKAIHKGRILWIAETGIMINQGDVVCKIEDGIQPVLAAV